MQSIKSIRLNSPLPGLFVVVLLATLLSPAACAADFVFYHAGGKSILPRVVVDRQAYIPLVNLLQLLNLPYSESASVGAFSITVGPSAIKLTRGRSQALLNDLPVALPAPVLYASNRWLVPVEFINRVLNRLLAQKIITSASGTRFATGQAGFNRLTVYISSNEQGTRLAIQLNSPADVEVKRETGLVRFNFGNIPIDPAKDDFSFKDNFIRSVDFEELQAGSQLTIQFTDNHSQARITRLASQNVYLLEVSKAAVDAATTESPLESSARRSSGLRVVLDPGHGGKDAGVRIAESLFEKDLVLALARKLQAELRNKLGGEILLTRQSDQDLSLDERAEIANRAQADLLISLHIGNSNQSMESKSYVYIYKPGGGNNDPAPGSELSGARKTPPLFLPWEEVQLTFLEQSQQLAGRLQTELNQQLNGAETSIPYRHAPLKLLAPVAAPAVLIELGNAQYAGFKDAITSPVFQQSLLLAIWTALDKYRQQLPTP